MGRETDTDKKILQAGIELFARQGYHGTSIKHITDKLGLTKPAVYAHFAGKAEIVHKIIQIYETDFVDELIRTVDECPGSALDKLHRAISFVSEFGVNNLSLAVAFISLGIELKGDPDFEPVLIRINSKYEAYLTELYRQGIRQGIFKKNLDPTIMALLFNAISRGMFLQWIDSRHRLDGEQYMRNFRITFFNGILA